ncbi:MAG: hypothetical protein JW852_04835 [Spirochaetales bacterium]|nr:hypothetical protein [Spirochaetales bacterium]
MAGGGKRGGNWKRNRKKHSKNAFPGKEMPKCPYCGQNVRDVLTAIAVESSDVPVHFDCVIKKIAETEELDAKDKICYLGKGSFGIVHFKNPSDPAKFTIKKRIQIEDEKKEISWRKASVKRVSFK